MPTATYNHNLGGLPIATAQIGVEPEGAGFRARCRQCKWQGDIRDSGEEAHKDRMAHIGEVLNPANRLNARDLVSACPYSRDGSHSGSYELGDDCAWCGQPSAVKVARA